MMLKKKISFYNLTRDSHSGKYLILACSMPAIVQKSWGVYPTPHNREQPATKYSEGLVYHHPSSISPYTELC